LDAIRYAPRECIADNCGQGRYLPTGYVFRDLGRESLHGGQGCEVECADGGFCVGKVGYYFSKPLGILILLGSHGEDGGI
jgi:hypothetical protein